MALCATILTGIPAQKFVEDRLRCLRKRHLELLRILLGRPFPLEVALEAVQNAMADALQALADGSVYEIVDRWAWLIRVAVNHALAICRRLSRDRARFIPLDEVELPSPIDQWIEAEAIRSAVDKLPAKYRDVIVYRYLEEHSHSETMEQFNLTSGSLHHRLSTARKLLRCYLK